MPWGDLVALAMYAPLIVLVHELGHALCARRGGYRVTSFGIGLGPPLWSIYLRSGVVLHIDRWFFAGGACTAIPVGPVTRRRLWFHGGGLLAQGVLGIGLLVLPDPWPLDRIAQFNLLVAVTNAIPWRAGGQASDGWALWDGLTQAGRLGSVLHQRPALLRMAAREAAVGSPMGQVYSEVCLAWADVVAGRSDQAAKRLAGDRPEATLEPWVDALYHYVLAEHHRNAGRGLLALQVIGRARGIDPLTDEARALLSVAQARAFVDLGATEQATAALARLAGVGGPIGAQAAVVLLWASLGGPTEDLELATWRVHRHAASAWLDPADAVLALRHAAAELSEGGRTRAADGARAAADALARRTVARLPAEDRRAFTSRLAAG